MSWQWLWHHDNDYNNNNYGIIIRILMSSELLWCHDDVYYFMAMTMTSLHHYHFSKFDWSHFSKPVLIILVLMSQLFSLWHPNQYLYRGYTFWRAEGTRSVPSARQKVYPFSNTTCIFLPFCSVTLFVMTY